MRECCVDIHVKHFEQLMLHGTSLINTSHHYPVFNVFTVEDEIAIT